MGILEKVFGSYSDKELKRIEPIIKKIDDFEPAIQKLSDEELKAQTEKFKERLKKGETLDDILPEAYATVREASVRTLGMRHFKVQLIGGVVLHQGRIAEMRTGEGKTLVATLPSYLNALTGEGVHVVTVNDYLAKRDSEWMGQIHEFLGLTVGVVLNDMKGDERRDAYNCDITYATNNELGFDYLRDNMVVEKSQMVQRNQVYAIIDEVDSVLVDEARTPLIISGMGTKSTELYKVADVFVNTLKKGRILNEEDALSPMIRAEIEEEGDFVVDEKAKTVSLTQEGVAKAEKYFNLENLSDPENMEYQHFINNALKANYNMSNEVDYVVSDDEILIVDEFTGRLMPGRRYSDGLHQAIEAKEKVKVKRESVTLATITFQNFFNRYGKKSGMTGTALTEESEFREIYGMDVIVIPTNKKILRNDHSDVVYKTETGKFRAVIKDIEECYSRKQPVLVGTISIEKSELLSSMLKKKNIPHDVLNAKYHEREAEIVSEAGKIGAITIATNMAGRGTDIVLEDGVKELGGLKIIGTERHESRRIDNQLRGRAGRQGDPGESRFYISLEDDLMRLFGSERIMTVVDALGLEEDDPIEHKILAKGIENAQKKVEGNNFGIRKSLLEYDQVMNDQREIIYAERMKVLKGEDLREDIFNMIKEVVNRAVNQYSEGFDNPKDWDYARLNEFLVPIYGEYPVRLTEEEMEKVTKESLSEELYDKAIKVYEVKEEEFGYERIREIERVIMLRVIDQKWMSHIDDMDQMRQGVRLQAYGQKDPIIEYRFLSYDMFNELSENIQLDTVRTLYSIRLVKERETEDPQREQVAKKMFTNKDDSVSKGPVVRKDDKVGRNDPCPCGSGKKYKQCCANK